MALVTAMSQLRMEMEAEDVQESIVKGRVMKIAGQITEDGGKVSLSEKLLKKKDTPSRFQPRERPTENPKSTAAPPGTRTAPKSSAAKAKAKGSSRAEPSEPLPLQDDQAPPELSDQALEDGLAELVRLEQRLAEQKAAMVEEMYLRGHMELDPETTAGAEWLLTGQEDEVPSPTEEEQETDAQGQAPRRQPRPSSRQ